MFRLGRAYDWQQCRIVLFGRELVGVTAIEYGVKKDVKNNYGAGGEPVSQGAGRKDYEGKIDLDIKEVLGILCAMGLPGDLTDIPAFDVVVIWGDDTENVTVTDVLIGCRFMEQKYSVKEGNSTVNVSIPLAIMKVQFGF